MRHSHRPRRVAAFVAESVNVQQLQTATEALNRTNRRAVLVSDQHALLRGYNGTAEINFAVAETTKELSTDSYDALVLLEGSEKLEDSATGLAKRFAEAGKPVIALTGTTQLLSGLSDAEAAGPDTSAAFVDGNLYASDEDDSDWKIITAVAEKLQGEMTAA